MSRSGGSNFSGGWSGGSSRSDHSSSSNFSGGWSSDSSSHSRSSSTNTERHSHVENNRTDVRDTIETVSNVASTIYVASKIVEANNANNVIKNSNNDNALKEVPNENGNSENNDKIKTPSNTNVDSQGSIGCGCFVIFVVLAILILAFFGGDNNKHSTDGTINSTIERKALDKSMVIKTGYYDDKLGWIKIPGDLVFGMKAFYDSTGVQPVLLLTDNIEGNYRPTDAEAEAYLKAVYDYLFQDQGHILVLFLEAKNAHAIWMYCGEDAATVMDEEARSILYSNIEHEYKSDRTNENMFSAAFQSTGWQIMGVYKEYHSKAWKMVGVLAVVMLVLCIVVQLLPSSTTQNVKLEDTGESEIVECQSCGAKNTIKGKEVKKCEYCGTMIKL